MNTTATAYCIKCLHPRTDHGTTCDHAGDAPCLCNGYVEMTLVRVDARKHMLESDERRDPNKDHSGEWERLAAMYKLIDGKTPNYHYCLFRAKKNQPPTDNDDPDGYLFNWQEEAHR